MLVRVPRRSRLPTAPCLLSSPIQQMNGMMAMPAAAAAAAEPSPPGPDAAAAPQTSGDSGGATNGDGGAANGTSGAGANGMAGGDASAQAAGAMGGPGGMAGMAPGGPSGMMMWHPHMMMMQQFQVRPPLVCGCCPALLPCSFALPPVHLCPAQQCVAAGVLQSMAAQRHDLLGVARASPSAAQARSPHQRRRRLNCPPRAPAACPLTTPCRCSSKPWHRWALRACQACPPATPWRRQAATAAAPSRPATVAWLAWQAAPRGPCPAPSQVRPSGTLGPVGAGGGVPENGCHGCLAPHPDWAASLPGCTLSLLRPLPPLYLCRHDDGPLSNVPDDAAHACE